MTANPIDVAIVDGVAVSKADVRSYEKVRMRQRMGDQNEVRNTKLSGQFGGIYVRSLQAPFDLDTSDTTTDDDNENCLIDFDGNRFKKVSFEVAPTERLVTVAGNVTVAADDADAIVIDKAVGAATKVSLCSAADRTKPVEVEDGKFDAATNNITIRPVRPTTVTMTIASPCVLTWTAHGKSAGDSFSLETSGALATNVAEDTLYYVLATGLATDTFRFAATPGGTAIISTGSQSGVHKAGTETIRGAAKLILNGNGAKTRLRPRADGTTWA